MKQQEIANANFTNTVTGNSFEVEYFRMSSWDFLNLIEGSKNRVKIKDIYCDSTEFETWTDIDNNFEIKFTTLQRIEGIDYTKIIIISDLDVNLMTFKYEDGFIVSTMELLPSQTTKIHILES